MTNAEIIMNNRVFLMEQGLLKATEQKMMYVGEDGVCRECFIPEEIHTFNAWKKRGYIVKRGEHAIAKFPIWKYRVIGKKEEQEEGENKEPQKGKCFMKVAFFFTADQVKEMTK